MSHVAEHGETIPSVVEQPYKSCELLSRVGNTTQMPHVEHGETMPPVVMQQQLCFFFCGTDVTLGPRLSSPQSQDRLL